MTRFIVRSDGLTPHRRLKGRVPWAHRRDPGTADSGLEMEGVLVEEEAR